LLPENLPPRNNSPHRTAARLPVAHRPGKGSIGERPSRSEAEAAVRAHYPAHREHFAAQGRPSAPNTPDFRVLPRWERFPNRWRARGRQQRGAWDNPCPSVQRNCGVGDLGGEPRRIPAGPSWYFFKPALAFSRRPVASPGFSARSMAAGDPKDCTTPVSRKPFGKLRPAKTPGQHPALYFSVFYLLLFIPTLLRYSLNPSPAHLQGRTALDPAAQIYQLPAEAALWKRPALLR
jgi:hypothetical protein